MKTLIDRKISLLIIITSIFVGVFMIGCKKKDRLSVSTFSFTISPPAVTLVKGGTQTFRIIGTNASGALTIDANWSLSSSTLGELNTVFGPSVILESKALGDLTVTATFQDVLARSQVAIVTFQPGSNTFDVIIDPANPCGGDEGNDIQPSPNPDSLTLSGICSGYTPEGIHFIRTTGADANESWRFNLTLSGTAQDLTSFAGGKLKFALRLARTLSAAENDDIIIRVEDVPGTVAGVTSDTITGFDRLSTDWQELEIPITSLAAVDETQIKVPFIILMGAGLAAPLTFDVDAVRWEK